MNKRLCKSDNKILLGVCGGIAEYFDADPTLVRLAVTAMIGLDPSFIPVYLLVSLILPNKENI